MSGEELDTIFSCQRSGLPFPSNKKDSVPVLICLAGFPDTASVWDPLVHQPELQRSHHIIALGLPGYHLDKLPSDHTWGFTIDEIQEALHKVVLYCRRNDSKNIHLLGHDWGALYGYIYVQEHKDDNLIQKYAALDIGISKPSEMPLAGTLKAIGYMVWLALCFVVNNLLGSSFASVLIKLYPWKYIGPLNWKETSLVLLQRPTKMPHVTYPYFQMLRNPKRVATSFSRTKHLPVCYMYGKQKKVNFHSQVYLDKLAETPGCSSMGFDGGHWFFTEKPGEVAATLQKFFLEED